MSNFAILDSQVKRAWKTKRFANGGKINLGNTNNEQFFIVKSDGVFEIEATERGVQICTNPKGNVSKRDYITTNRSNFLQHSRGHTHPKGRRSDRLELTPGPEDGGIAKDAAVFGKPSYLIANKACYSIFWTGTKFVITELDGSGPRQSKLDAVAAEWVNRPPGFYTCKRFPKS